MIRKYVIHIRALKQVLKHGLVLKMHRVIKFNKNAWLQSYMVIIAELRKKGETDFQKDFFKLMNSGVSGKAM